MLFRKCGCLVGPENRIFWKLISVDRKKRLWLWKWISVPIFTSNEFQREREREGEACTHQRRSHALSSSLLRSQAPAPSIAISRHRLRSHLRADRARSWLTLRKIKPSIAISPSRRSRSCEAARCFVRLRSMVWSSDWSLQSTAPSNPVERQASIWVCLFLLLFQTPKNIFRKIFENAIKHMKTFSFPENGIFSGNAFTRTKHSLNISIHFQTLLKFTANLRHTNAFTRTKHSLNISIQFQTLLKFTANLRGQFTMGHLLFLNIE